MWVRVCDSERDQALGVDEELSISWCNYFKLGDKKDIKGIWRSGCFVRKREKKRRQVYTARGFPFRHTRQVALPTNKLTNDFLN